MSKAGSAGTGLFEEDVCANAARDGSKDTNPNILPDIGHSRSLSVKALVSATTRPASQDSLPKFGASPRTRLAPILAG